MALTGGVPGTPASYRPEIDGLRAVAVLPVVLFHAGMPGFAGGFVGVDIFFVISGYLITSILARQVAAGGIRYGEFFERRVRRIVPALLPMLIAAAAAAWWTMVPEDFRRFSQALAATALFGSNMLFGQKADYFFSPEGFAPLLHTWSLSVEEQFYLLYPAFLALAWRSGRTSATTLVALACAVSLAAAFAFQPTFPRWAFYLLPTRLWELLAGASLALVPASNRTGWPALFGLAAIVAGFAIAGPDSAAPGLVSLLPVTGTLLILHWGTPGSLTARLLGVRPLVLGGLISYGLYLWHVPLLALVQYHFRAPAPAGWRVTAVIMALALALLSWRLIERPIRALAVLRERRALLIAALTPLALLAMLGSAGHFELIGSRVGATATALGADYAGAGLPERALPGGRLAFVLYGDSHAHQYYRALEKRFGRGAILTQSGCLSLPLASNAGELEAGSGCEENSDRLRALAAQRRPPLVIWAQRWERNMWFRGDAGAIGRTTRGPGAAALASGLDQMRRALPVRTRLVLIGNSPTAWAAGPELSLGYLRCQRYVDTACPVAYPAIYAEGRGLNRALAGFAERHERVIYVDAASAVCSGGLCPIVRRGRLIYSDGSHFTALGAEQVADAVAARVKAEPDLADALP